MRPRAIGSALLLSIAAVTAWWLSGVGEDTGVAPDGIGPEWYFEGASLVATDGDGRLVYRIEAPHITHDPGDDTAVLDEPRLEWLQGGGTPMRIAAHAGRADAASRRVSLAGGVTIVDESTGTRIEFRAPDLVVDDVRRVASTDAEVLVFTAQGELRGVGLVADMNAGTIRIESAVRGRYVP